MRRAVLQQRKSISLRSEDVSDKTNCAKGDQKVVQLNIGDHGQKVGGETKGRTQRLDPDVGTSKARNEVQHHNQQDALNRSRERAQVQCSRVVLLPRAQIKVTECYKEDFIC